MSLFQWKLNLHPNGLLGTPLNRLNSLPRKAKVLTLWVYVWGLVAKVEIYMCIYMITSLLLVFKFKL